MEPASPLPLLSARSLGFSYPGRTSEVFSDVSFDLRSGQTLSLIGQSGSGKSTLAKCLVGLLRATSGSIHFAGENLLTCPAETLKKMRREFHLMFQDSGLALNPHFTVREVLEEPFTIHERQTPRSEWMRLIDETCAQLMIPSSWLLRRGAELSGGQRRRITLARALVLRPKLVILDEPFTGLDPSGRAEMANRLLDLQEERELALLLIAHDLRLVSSISDQVLELRSGKGEPVAFPVHAMY
jgi:peptide/nickel transport system ATP-binding protein